MAPTDAYNDPPPSLTPDSERQRHQSEALVELGDFTEDFARLHGADDHGELFARLRQDDGFAQAVARADAITYLRQWFTPRLGWITNTERSGAIGPGGVAVEWTYEGVHDRGEFNSLTPTGRTVVMRGVTMVGLEKGRMKLSRYCDWAGCFAQLGLTLNWRIPVPSTPADPGAGRQDVAGGAAAS